MVQDKRCKYCKNLMNRSEHSKYRRLEEISNGTFNNFGRDING